MENPERLLQKQEDDVSSLNEFVQQIDIYIQDEKGILKV